MTPADYAWPDDDLRARLVAGLGPICEAELELADQFDVMCARHPNHTGRHIATREGYGGVLATITWESAR